MLAPVRALASWAGVGPVLVVDDEETVSRLLVHVLATAGLTADTVSGGAAALDRLHAAPQRYGLLFLDLHMPDPRRTRGATGTAACFAPKCPSSS